MRRPPGLLASFAAALLVSAAQPATVSAQPAAGTPGQNELPSSLDPLVPRPGVGEHVEQSAQASGERRSADYAYGAYQRGYFLTAFAIALEQARNGKPPAQTLLGELLSRGLGVKRDYVEAAGWYELAAKSGDAEALYALGRMHLEGLGVGKDEARAADLFKQAGSNGHPVAMREFAYLLLQGKGIEKNPMLAAAHLRNAARAGDMDAQFALGGLFMEGVGVVKNEAEAARWYAEAARSGHVPAQIEYAILLFQGRGVPKDEAVAARWFRQAALSDNPVAQVRLARLLAEGRGLKQDEQEAAQWYLLARRKGVRDETLEDKLLRLSADERRAAEAAAERWLSGRSGVLASVPLDADERTPPVDTVTR